jgi:hypothetical protein
MFIASATNSSFDFSDIKDDLDNAKVKGNSPTVFVENCKKCNGTGIYRGFSSHVTIALLVMGKEY